MAFSDALMYCFALWTLVVQMVKNQGVNMVRTAYSISFQVIRLSSLIMSQCSKVAFRHIP